MQRDLGETESNSLPKREDYERRFAIIIGVNAYGDEEGRLTDLSYAVNDAREFRRALTEFAYEEEHVLYLTAERREGKVMPAVDSDGLATNKAVQKAFTRWLEEKEITAHDAVIVFFSGHGWYETEEARGFLGLTDTTVSDRAESAIEVEWLRDELAKLPDKSHRLLILDCCYSGALFQQRNTPLHSSPAAASAPESRALLGIPALRGQMDVAEEVNLAGYFELGAFFGMSAGRFQPVADQAPGGVEHSPFTRALVDVMRERANTIREDHAFTFRQLAAQVEGRVAFEEGSVQIPDWGRLGRGNGDFVFRVKLGTEDPVRTPREESLVQGAANWLQSADRQPLPLRQILAARAIGFEEFGRPSLEEDQLEPNDSPSYRFWNSLPLLPTARRVPEIWDRAKSMAQPFHETESFPHQILIWSSPTSRRHLGGIRSVAWSSDGKRLASADSNGTIRLWNPNSGNLIEQFQGHEHSVNALSWSPDCKQLASAGDKWTIRIWNISNSVSLARDLSAGEGHVYGLTWSPDGSRLATSAGTGFTIWELASGEGKAFLMDGLHGVFALSWSPEGERLASAGMREKANGEVTGAVHFWDTAAGQQVGASIDGQGTLVNALAFSPDGSRLATGSDDGAIRQYCGSSGKILAAPIKMAHGKNTEVKALVWDPLGSILASSGKDGTIRFWDPDSGELLGDPFHGHIGQNVSISWCPDGRRLASGGAEGILTIWDTTDPANANATQSHQGGARIVTWSPDGRMLASAGEDGAIRFWDTSNGSARYSPLLGHNGEVSDLDFSPDGSLLASAGADGTIRLWKMDANQPCALGSPLLGHGKGNLDAEWICAVAFSPQGNLLASAGADGTIRLWDVATFQEDREPLKGHKENLHGWFGVCAIAWSPDGSRIASGGNDGTIRLWNAETGQEYVTPLLGHGSDGLDFGSVNSVAWAPYGDLLVSGGDDSTVRLWDPIGGQQVNAPLVGHDAAVSSVAFSPDGSRIVSAATEDEGTIRFWEVGSGAPIGLPYSGHNSAIDSVRWSPDGIRLASAGRDGMVKLWEAASNRSPVVILRGNKQWANEISFSPDGRSLASAGHDGTLSKWNAFNGRLLGTPRRLKGWFESVQFNPDGSHLASGGMDGRIRLWDDALRQSEGSSILSHSMMTRLAWHPEGKWLATIGQMNKGEENVTSLRIWDTSSWNPIGEPFEGNGQLGSCLAWNPDGSRLAVGGKDGTVQLWDPSSGELIGAPLKAFDGLYVRSIAFSPKSRYLACVGDEGMIRLWNTEKGQFKEFSTEFEGRANVVAWSPDGLFIAVGDKDGAVWLWESETLRSLGKALVGEPGDVGITDVEFSPDGTRLAGAWGTGEIRIAEIRTTLSPKEFHLDWSAYLGNGWVTDQTDVEVRSLKWESLSDNLLSERQFEMVNIRPDSTTALLQSAPDDAERHLVLFGLNIQQRVPNVNAAWACYRQCTENRERLALKLYRSLYRSVISPRRTQPKGWLCDRFSELEQNHSEVRKEALDEFTLFEWNLFYLEVLMMEGEGLEDLALDSLTRYKSDSSVTERKPTLQLAEAVLLHRLGQEVGGAETVGLPAGALGQISKEISRTHLLSDREA